MRAASSAERTIEVSAATRAAMIALAFIPALHLGLAVLPIVFVVGGRGDPRLLLLSPCAIYLVPPIVVRIGMWLLPLPEGRIDLSSPLFLRWWFSAQWQVLFARLRWLEELLRVIPGLYSSWLRLWGAEIGSLVYWTPGVTILDRPLIRVGSRVAFGSGVQLIAHVIGPTEDSRSSLFIAPIFIGDDALVGAFSFVLPGCSIAAGEVTPPFRRLHPFSRWERGRRVANPAALSRWGVNWAAPRVTRGGDE